MEMHSASACLGLPESSLAECHQRVQIFRRDTRNYTVTLPANGDLVTIRHGLVARVDPVQPGLSANGHAHFDTQG